MTPRIGYAAFSLAALIIALSGPVAAREAGKSGRYTMHPADGGFIRLDTMTGAVSHCQKAEAKWSCKPVDGATASDRDEIARLRKENAELKGDITKLEGMLGLDQQPGSRRPDPPAPGSGKHSFKLPSEKDVDEALDYFERMLRKFQERLQRLERQGPPETKRL